MPKQEYDAQGKLWHHYVMLAGWTQERADALLIKKFKATHFNALAPGQKKAALGIMKRYVVAAEKDKAKRLRSMIMARVAKNGQTIEWLHDAMETWGAGRSLRKLNYAETVEVWNAVMECFPVHAQPKKEEQDERQVRQMRSQDPAGELQAAPGGDADGQAEVLSKQCDLPEVRPLEPESDRGGDK